MEIGADEFEQNLPLLQELVLGADFVGKMPALRASSPASPGLAGQCRVVRVG